MGLGDVVNVSILLSAGGLSLPGFGTPLILGGYAKTWAERVRSYADLVALSADFAAGTPEYLAAQTILSQNPKPSRVMVGRGQNKPTQKWTITPVTTIQAVTTFTVKIGGVAYSFTSDATPTAGEVVLGLTPLVNAATGTHGLTASGTNTLVLTGTAGSWQTVEVGDVNYLRIVQDHVDPGVATDLAAIALESSDWYALLNPWNSTAELLAAAAWCEANGKLFLAQSQETEIIDTADASANDVAHQAKALGYANTAIAYSPATADFLDAAWAGACLPLEPGSETWALKTLAGVAARIFTSTHITNLKAKRCGYYTTIAGRNVTFEGKLASSTVGFIDVRRFIDWLVQEIQASCFLAMAGAPKIPYTDAGATVLQAATFGALERGENRGGLVPGTSKVTVPKVATQSENDRANRYMPGIDFSAQLAGAAHSLAITGRVTV